MRLTFDSVDQVKQIASLMWADLIHSVEDLNRTKRLSNRELLLSGGWS